jgi:dolichol-phosphate mannosyltransferase
VRTLVVVPTYDEAPNIEAFLRRVREVVPAADVLVVDDNSPDGTADLAEAVGADVGQVKVLRRPGKDGLGNAYRAGIAFGLDEGYEALIQMDADFSHDPADVPRLVAATGAADLVLGSRYMPGGGITDWGLLRRLISRGGCAYARWLLAVPVRDLTGGFKCFHRRVLEGIDLEHVRSDGYGFQIELTYRAIKAGFTVAEVPILFHEREVGNSKMTTRIALEAVWKVPALRLRLR